jgi:hypothetical protein
VHCVTPNFETIVSQALLLFQPSVGMSKSGNNITRPGRGTVVALLRKFKTEKVSGADVVAGEFSSRRDHRPSFDSTTRKASTSPSFEPTLTDVACSNLSLNLIHPSRTLAGRESTPARIQKELCTQIMSACIPWYEIKWQV